MKFFKNIKIKFVLVLVTVFVLLSPPLLTVADIASVNTGDGSTNVSFLLTSSVAGPFRLNSLQIANPGVLAATLQFVDSPHLAILTTNAAYKTLTRTVTTVEVEHTTFFGATFTRTNTLIILTTNTVAENEAFPLRVLMTAVIPAGTTQVIIPGGSLYVSQSILVVPSSGDTNVTVTLDYTPLLP